MMGQTVPVQGKENGKGKMLEMMRRKEVQGIY